MSRREINILTGKETILPDAPILKVVFTTKQLVAATKVEAQKRIIAIEASWNDTNYVVKQLNALMISIDFVFDIIQRADGGTVTLTQADKDTAASLQTKKTQIEAIRTASNLIEDDIDAGSITTESQVFSSVLWP